MFTRKALTIVTRADWHDNVDQSKIIWQQDKFDSKYPPNRQKGVRYTSKHFFPTSMLATCLLLECLLFFLLCNSLLGACGT